jgi:hypothetical protein
MNTQNLTLKTYILTNYNGHKLVVLKRGQHTVRLQYNPADGKARLWASDGVSRFPLTFTKVCHWKAALSLLVGLEVALYDRVTLVTKENQPASRYEGNVIDGSVKGSNIIDGWPSYLGKPLAACNNALQMAG